MAFGLPYMGSKNIYAKQICEALPSGNRLVDLFAGGCAVTDCAIRKYSNKWESFLINDIAHEPLDLYAKCLCGENPVSYKWVTREEFKSADWATRLVWSYASCTLYYIYSKNTEAVKHDIECWIVDGENIHISGILDKIDLPTLNTRQARYSWWKSNRKELIKKLYIPKECHRLEEMERLERLELSECPEVLKRLKFSYLSYEQYEYCDGDVVYCDIPYRKTRCEAYKETGFDHEAFWEWAKSRPFDVYVSERIVPSDAEVVLTKKLQSRANPGNTVGQVTEYLVRV